MDYANLKINLKSGIYDNQTFNTKLHILDIKYFGFKMPFVFFLVQT
jgi:hypothetical protein